VRKRKCVVPLCSERVCRKCGYDLQGAAGDPICCPECGTTSSLAGLSVAEDRIGAALSYLEELPVLCVGISLIAITFFVLDMMFATPWSRIPVAGFIMVYWLLLVFRYARESSWGQGWYLIIIVFHLIGLLGVAFIMLVWWSAVSLLVYYGRGSGVHFGGAWVARACIGVLSVAALFTLIPFLYWRAKKFQARRQRHWAIRLAQQKSKHPKRQGVAPHSTEVYE